MGEDSAGADGYGGRHEDVTQQAREDIKRLYFGIHWQLGKFNQPDGPDPFTGGGPTREDLEGTVRHDIG